jgi:hypothetical protein
MVQMQTLKDKNKSSKTCLKLVVQCNCKRDKKLQFIAIADKAGNCSSTNLKKRLEMYGSMQITKLIGNFCSKFKAFIAEDI